MCHLEVIVDTSDGSDLWLPYPCPKLENRLEKDRTVFLSFTVYYLTWVVPYTVIRTCMRRRQDSLDTVGRAEGRYVCPHSELHLWKNSS
jgi:hypothetical protein